ncbi:MAG TPA: Nramp family divalent metal transporter, partial [Pyrinomonadaceae bacterium]
MSRTDVREMSRRLWRSGARRVRRTMSQRTGFIAYLAVIGPGMIAANAGNDAGGIATYSTSGAEFRYTLLWTFLPILVSLGLVQEMCARMGVVTGKGLADLIRERFGVRWTMVVMSALLVANAGVTVSEFVGIAAATELFGVPRQISVPLAALSVWWLVVKGSYRRVERVFLLMSLVFLGYIVSAFLARPDWGEVAQQMARPSLRFDNHYLFTLIALIGTTISPYMQVFVQSSVVEKGVREEDYSLTRADVWVG